MRISIILPFHNEAEHLDACLKSFVSQSRPPDRLVLVNDSSTDESAAIAKHYADHYAFITLLSHSSAPTKIPGEKVIRTFYKGMTSATPYDLIGKFDADILLPPTYFERCERAFKSDPQLGIFGGLLHIKSNGKLIYENISNRQHVRGPIKLYSKACFESINGLLPALGWDSIDTLLAEARGFGVRTDETLVVEHLRPTNNDYLSTAYLVNRGASFYDIGYDLTLSGLSAVKMAFKKKSIRMFIFLMRGYFSAVLKEKRLVDNQARKDILKIRYRKLFKALHKN